MAVKICISGDFGPSRQRHDMCTLHCKRRKHNENLIHILNESKTTDFNPVRYKKITHQSS